LVHDSEIIAHFAIRGYPPRAEEEATMPEPRAQVPPLIELDDLPRTQHAHEFVGADHGDVPFSIILVHSAPGAGPALHRHPYAEVFVVESGLATIRLGEDEVVARGGQIAVAPANVPHGFTNTGDGELRLTAIHGASRFDTEWLSGRDSAWASKRE
jgi:quercetin dioxygenase-like cupin family protein